MWLLRKVLVVERERFGKMQFIAHDFRGQCEISRDDGYDLPEHAGEKQGEALQA